jgi:hypothetical protein
VKLSREDDIEYAAREVDDATDNTTDEVDASVDDTSVSAATA